MASPRLTSVGIALGSNLGDRLAELHGGFAFLRTFSTSRDIDCSNVIETAPVDCPSGSQPFLNAVAEIALDPKLWPPQLLLDALQAYETQRGRPRQHARNSPRPIDLDILYYGDLTIDSSRLTVPHPRLTRRRFVLEPLAQLRPALILPGQTLTIGRLLAMASQAT